MTDVYLLALGAVTPPTNPNGSPSFPNCSGHIGISTGSGFQFSAAGAISCKFVCPANPDNVHYLFIDLDSGDFNGDGRSDLLYRKRVGTFPDQGECNFSIGPNTNLNIRLGNADGTLAAGTAWGSTPTAASTAAGDLNGDGRTDMVRIESTGNATALLSTGSTFLAQPVSAKPAGACSTCNLRVGDFNGDGAADALSVLRGPTTANFTAQFSMFTWRNGALVGQNWGTGLATYLYPMHALEFDGDGKTDLLTTWNAAGSWSATINRISGPVPDLLTGITSSLGGTTTVAYAPSSQWTNTNLPFVTKQRRR